MPPWVADLEDALHEYAGWTSSDSSLYTNGALASTSHATSDNVKCITFSLRHRRNSDGDALEQRLENSLDIISRIAWIQKQNLYIYIYNM